MRNDEALLNLLTDGLAPADRAPSDARIEELRAHIVASARRPVPRVRRRAAVAFAMAVALAGGAVLGHDLPRPIRAAAHAIGLPVESTTLVDARAELDRLGRGLAAKDTGEVIAADNAMLGLVKKLDPDEKRKIVPVAHEVHERAIALLRTMGICSASGPCPPG